MLAKGTALGADAYVTKPFSTRELAERVRELLGRLRRHRRVDRRELAGRCCAARRGCVARCVGLAALGARARWRTLDPPERAAFARCWRCAARCCLLAAGWCSRSALGALAASRYRRWVPRRRACAERAGALLAATGALETDAAAGASSDAEVAPARARSRQVDPGVRAPARRTARRHRGAGAGGQPRHRAGTQPARGADVGADAKRRRVQPRRPHPALQQPRAPAIPCALERAGAGRRRRADRARPLDLRRASIASSSPTRSRASSSACSAAPPAVGAVRHRHARRAAAARADGAGARRSAAKRRRRAR